MRIIISGSTGLVGSATVHHLEGANHRVRRLVRPDTDLQAPKGTQIPWSVKDRRINADQLEGHDAVVHLAGEPIASGKWTEEKKKRLRDSRIDGTTLLSETLAKLVHPPKVLISASAVGYYGDRGDEELDENASPGSGFLEDICKDWEAATAPASAAGIRVVHLRVGIVLAKRGGALAQMLPIFKLGFGGKIGSGQQYMSWISLDDMTRIIAHCITDESISGPVNATAPNPVRNATFTKTLGHVLKRPTFMPVPRFALRMRFGEMADALLYASTRAIPAKLESHGYEFHHPTLEKALQDLLR